MQKTSRELEALALAGEGGSKFLQGKVDLILVIPGVGVGTIPA